MTTFAEMTEALYRRIEGRTTEESEAKLVGTKYELCNGGDYVCYLRRVHEKEYRKRIIHGVYYDWFSWLMLQLDYNGGEIILYQKPLVEFVPYQRKAMLYQLKEKLNEREENKKYQRKKFCNELEHHAWWFNTKISFNRDAMNYLQ